MVAMMSVKRTRGALLLGSACLLTLATPAAQADPIVAQRLFLEATALTAQARTETDPARRLRLLERAQNDLQGIVTLHGDSPLAAQLSRGQAVGGFDPRGLERDLAAARSAAPGAKPVANTTVAAPPAAAAPTAPAATAQKGRLPTAAVDPKSTAGKVLGDVMGALDKATGGETASVLKVSAPITAVQSGDTVTLTFPGLALITDADSETRLGDVRLDVTPQADNRYGFSLPLPSQVTGFTKGKPQERLTLAAEPITGVWAPEAGTALRLYVRITDLKAEELAPEPKLILKIASLSMEQKGDLQNDRLSGDFTFDMRDLLANDPSSSQQVRLGKLAFSSQALDFDLPSWRKLSEAMQGNGDPQLAGLQFLAGGGHWAKVGTSLAMNDLSVTDAGKPLGSLGGAHFGLDLDARPQAGATLSIKLGFDKVQATESPMAELPPALIPHSFGIDAALEPLPLRQMAEATLQAQLETKSLKQAQAGAGAAQGGDDGEDQEAAEDAQGPSAGDQMLGVLMSAQPALKLAQASMASEMLQMSMSGTVSVDPESAIMSRGSLSVKVAGLDQFKAYLDANAKTDKSLREYVPMVVALRGLGNDTQLNGAKAKEFKLVAAKDGSVTINGTPWQALMDDSSQQKKAKDKKR
jgi:hypothetical protein